MYNATRLILKSITICFLLIYSSSCKESANEHDRKLMFQLHLGTYVLDTTRTNLESYKGDIKSYADLQITFDKDSTFFMNMSVPFMNDSSGHWVTGDGSPYEFNKLYFNNFNGSKDIHGEQFYPPYLDGNDSIFLINSCTPKIGKQAISLIYFKKI